MDSQRSFIVYILKNAQEKRYIGLTSDLAKRLREHNDGKSTYTRYRGPWSLIWNSKEFTLSDARKLEAMFKRQKGGKGLEKLMGLHQGS